MTSRRVVVTGAGGFIGSHLVERLVAQGFSVTAMGHYSGSGENGWLNSLDAEVRDQITVISGDITDVEFVRRSTENMDIVFNLAALIAIPYSYLASRSYVNTNVIGALNVCEAIRSHQNRLVHISTSEVYGTPKEVPISETHPINPQSPYAASKAAADHICKSYYSSFEIDMTIVRPFNTFGPRQSQRAVIPTILNQLASGASKIFLGSTSPKRDFTYVEDTVRAIELAGTSTSIKGEIIQLGTGETVSIGDLVKLCERVTGREIEIELQGDRVRPSMSEVEILLSDPSYAFTSLGWKAEKSLEEGLIATYDWIKRQNKAINSSLYSI